MFKAPTPIQNYPNAIGCAVPTAAAPAIAMAQRRTNNKRNEVCRPHTERRQAQQGQEEVTVQQRHQQHQRNHNSIQPHHHHHLNNNNSHHQPTIKTKIKRKFISDTYQWKLKFNPFQPRVAETILINKIRVKIFTNL